jgi:hypothetical protein
MNFLAHADAITICYVRTGRLTQYDSAYSSYLFKEPIHLNSFYIRKSDSIQQFDPCIR